jgi:cell shape-determining protein MreC
LFFIAVWPLAAEEARLPSAATNASADELRVLVGSLRADNQRLKADLEQRETIIRLLTENLAVARTESELFHKKWSEAQLRAQTLGVDLADNSAAQTQRQLAESVRALYLADAERQRLVTQMQRLIEALQKPGDVAGELARTKALFEAADRPFSGSAANSQTQGGLGAATVLDVNPDLRLVVLNIGQLQGARIGMPMVVMRGEHVVAELKIVEVRQRICGALIERVKEGVTLKTGDVARVARNS